MAIATSRLPLLSDVVNGRRDRRLDFFFSFGSSRVSCRPNKALQREGAVPHERRCASWAHSIWARVRAGSTQAPMWQDAGSACVGAFSSYSDWLCVCWELASCKQKANGQTDRFFLLASHWSIVSSARTYVQNRFHDSTFGSMFCVTTLPHWYLGISAAVVYQMMLIVSVKRKEGPVPRPSSSERSEDIYPSEAQPSDNIFRDVLWKQRGNWEDGARRFYLTSSKLRAAQTRFGYFLCWIPCPVWSHPPDPWPLLLVLLFALVPYDDDTAFLTVQPRYSMYLSALGVRRPVAGSGPPHHIDRLAKGNSLSSGLVFFLSAM